MIDIPKWSGTSYTFHPRKSDEVDQPQRVILKTGAITGVSVNGQRISITPPVTFQEGDRFSIVCNDAGDPTGVTVYLALDPECAPGFGQLHTIRFTTRVRSYFSTLWLAIKGVELSEDGDDDY